jgi:peroxiredoxin
MLIAIGLLVATNKVARLSTLFARGPNLEARVQEWVASPPPPAPGAPPTADASRFEPAPDVELKTLDGQPFRLSELRGRVVLLNFWATWCGPCRKEIPELNAMHRDLEARGFSVVGVSTYDSADQIKDFQKDLRQDYKLALGDADAQAKFAVSALPTTFIIDREGRIREKIIGERNRVAFERYVNPLLAETPIASNQ